MFEVGFSELLVIFVLALVVLGPEKLPRVASQVGRWIGRARSMARQFKDQLEEEVSLEEARRARAQMETRAAAASPHSALPAPEPPQLAPELPQPAPEPPQPSPHPDTYSHAHPTDSQGRPVASEPEARQHDWVSGTRQEARPAAASHEPGS